MKLKSILLLTASSLVFANSYSQSVVQTAGKKYVLLEEGTGTWCGYCPDGAEDIERNIEPHFSRCIVASFHNGDPMALSPDDYNNDYIGCSTCMGWPGGTIDRNTFSGSVEQMRPWESYVATDTGLAPKFDVIMKSYIKSTHDSVFVKLTAKCLVGGSGTWNVNVFITEDSISSAGANGQGNYANCGCSHNYTLTQNPPYDTSWFWHDGNGVAETAIPTAHYSHMNVVRAVLGTNIFGDAAATLVNPLAGATYSKIYKYAIPSGSAWNEMNVIGLVQKYVATDVNQCPIENVIKSKMRLMGTANILLETPSVTNSFEDFTVSPNPAKNVLTLTGTFNTQTSTETTITIVNSIGQVVFKNTYPSGGSIFNESISLKDFSNGMYFMNIQNNGENASRKFTVAK